MSYVGLERNQLANPVNEKTYILVAGVSYMVDLVLGPKPLMVNVSRQRMVFSLKKCNDHEYCPILQLINRLLHTNLLRGPRLSQGLAKFY